MLSMTTTAANGSYRAPSDQLATACDLLRALGTRHRLAIVLALGEGSRCVHELVESLAISQSLTSQHLRVLRGAGLVVGVRRGKETVYSLADDHVARLARDAMAHGSEPAVHAPENPEIVEEHER
jgi:DNA-binding transcriptional ArsR family regulator